MKCTYLGVVRDRLDDHVVVAFETEDDIVEHRYLREQFIGEHLPEEGTRLLVEISLIEEPPPPAREEDDLIDLRCKRENLVEGSDTF